jgi:hypothetical protein
MSVAAEDAARYNEKGAFRLGMGAWLGLLAALIAIVLPSLVLFAGAYNPGGFFSFAPGLVQLSGVLVLVGAVLYILSLLLYRRAFSALRRVDPEFSLASFLCLLGSVGFVLLLVAAAVLTGTASTLLGCVHGQPTHALSCLESNQPLGAYTAIAGFVLAWLGGFGIVYGLWRAGSHFSDRALDLGAVVYLLFLFLVLVPFLEIAFPFPGGQFLLVIVPVLSLAAPGFVLLGSSSKRRADASAGVPAA